MLSPPKDNKRKTNCKRKNNFFYGDSRGNLNGIALKYRYEQMKVNEIYRKMKEKESLRQTDPEIFKLIQNLKVTSSSTRNKLNPSSSKGKTRIGNIFEKVLHKGSLIDLDIKKGQIILSQLKQKRLNEGIDNYSINNLTIPSATPQENVKEQEFIKRRRATVKTIIDAHHNNIKRNESFHSDEGVNFEKFMNEVNNNKLLKQSLSLAKLSNHNAIGDINIENNNSNNKLFIPLPQFINKKGNTIQEEKSKLNSKYRHNIKRNSFFMFKDFDSNKADLFQQYQPRNFYTRHRTSIMNDKFTNEKKLRKTLTAQNFFPKHSSSTENKHSLLNSTNEFTNNVLLNSATNFYKSTNNFNNKEIIVQKRKSFIGELFNFPPQIAMLHNNSKSQLGETITKNNSSKIFSLKKSSSYDNSNSHYNLVKKKEMNKYLDNHEKLVISKLNYAKLKKQNKILHHKLNKRSEQEYLNRMLLYSDQMDEIGNKICNVIDGVSDYVTDKINKLIELGSPIIK